MSKKWTFGYAEANTAAEEVLRLTNNGERNEVSCNSFRDTRDLIVGLVILLSGGYLERSPFAHGSDHSYLVATPRFWMKIGGSDA